MEFSEFRSRLEKGLAMGLPGEEAQYSLAPQRRQRLSELDLDLSRVKKAGVLALFEHREGLAQIVLTKRSEYPGAHSGQISFPGGRYEDEDLNFENTAKRETEEEVGLKADAYQIISPLTELYIPPSNFLVHPFLAISEEPTDLKREIKEVAQIIRLPFQEFLEPTNVQEIKVTITGGMKLPTTAFVVQGHIIWGATAMILSEIRAIVINS